MFNLSPRLLLILVFVGLIPALLFTLVTSDNLLGSGEALGPSNILLLPLGLGLGLGLFTVLVRYLQTDSSTRSDYILDQLSLRLHETESTLAKLASRDLQDSDRVELVAQLRKSIEEAADKEFLDGIRRSVAESSAHFELNKQLEEQHRKTDSRLNMELRALTRRGTVNLSLGITTAIAGMAVLGYFLVTMPKATEVLDLAGNFSARISLVILIEVFAYFFLRLYSNSLVEIKYFQNEITNMEFKFLALRAAADAGNEKFMGGIIRRFSQTERNYVLRKGQTTVEVERSKIEKETIVSLLGAIFKTVSPKK